MTLSMRRKYAQMCVHSEGSAWGSHPQQTPFRISTCQVSLTKSSTYSLTWSSRTYVTGIRPVLPGAIRRTTWTAHWCSNHITTPYVFKSSMTLTCHLWLDTDCKDGFRIRCFNCPNLLAARKAGTDGEFSVITPLVNLKALYLQYGGQAGSEEGWFTLQSLLAQKGCVIAATSGALS